MRGAVLAAVVVAAGMASASIGHVAAAGGPSQCYPVWNQSASPDSASVRCLAGTGWYRVRIHCYYYDPPAPGATVSGPWRYRSSGTANPSASSATCPSSYPFSDWVGKQTTTVRP